MLFINLYNNSVGAVGIRICYVSNVCLLTLYCSTVSKWSHSVVESANLLGNIIAIYPSVSDYHKH